MNNYVNTNTHMDDETVKRYIVSFATSEHTNALIRANAKARHMSLSAFIRETVLNTSVDKFIDAVSTVKAMNLPAYNPRGEGVYHFVFQTCFKKEHITALEETARHVNLPINKLIKIFFIVWGMENEKKQEEESTKEVETKTPKRITKNVIVTKDFKEFIDAAFEKSGVKKFSTFVCDVLLGRSKVNDDIKEDIPKECVDIKGKGKKKLASFTISAKTPDMNSIDIVYPSDETLREGLYYALSKNPVIDKEEKMSDAIVDKVLKMDIDKVFAPLLNPATGEKEKMSDAIVDKVLKMDIDKVFAPLLKPKFTGTIKVQFMKSEIKKLKHIRKKLNLECSVEDLITTLFTAIITAPHMNSKKPFDETKVYVPLSMFSDRKVKKLNKKKKIKELIVKTNSIIESFGDKKHEIRTLIVKHVINDGIYNVIMYGEVKSLDDIVFVL